MSQAAILSEADILRRDRRVTTLIGVSHGASHFYRLALPPLFYLINASEGISFALLGALTAAFYIASAVCQPLSGFLVDKFGARSILLMGLGLMSGSTALMGILPYYPLLFALSILAGIGNSVFHPCDYSIMNATISEKRMARAFSYHMFGGYGLRGGSGRDDRDRDCFRLATGYYHRRCRRVGAVCDTLGRQPGFPRQHLMNAPKPGRRKKA